VTGTINANGATNVAFNAKEGVTFSEGMNPLTVTTTNFLLQNARGLVAGTVGYSGVNAVFTPLTALEPSTLYMVTIKGGVGGVADLAGNAMAADYVYSWTTGAAPDTTAPTVTGTINANGATNVAFNAKEGVTFSEGMNPLTVTTSNFLVKNGSTPVVGTVSYSGVNAVFTPLVNLAPATLYTVTIKGGVGGVADLAGNVMVADYVYSWTTGAVPDTTAPAVTGTINANGATNVAFNTKEGATFSERMNPLTVTTANFLVKNGSTPVVGTLSYSGVNAVFTPLVNLAPATLYTVTIKGGVGGVADLAGNVMAADYVYSWTTGAAPDTTAPTVVSVSPSAGATGVPVNSSVRATFNEAMDPLTISTASFTVAGVTGTVSFDALTRTATFKPGSDLANNTLYTATVTTAAKDLAGNALAVNKVWTFTTAAAVVVVVPAVDLAGAAPFGTFGGTAGMTNTGTLTLVNGDIGTIATGTSGITGFHDTTGDIYTESPANRGAVSGKIYTCTNSTIGPTSAGPNAAACAIATKARLDAQTAYLALVAKAPLGASPAPGANLAGLTLLPGVYKAPNGSFLIEGGNLTLDAQGDANATWVFQMATTLTVGGPGAAFPQSIILAGGAQPKNVFWQVGSFATINAAGGGTMVGTIISQAGASFSTAGNVNIVTLLGRALSLGASVTLVNTVITVPAP
jgi:hypothetical protein